MEIPASAIEVLAKRKHRRIYVMTGHGGGVPPWTDLDEEKRQEYREAARADLEEPAEIIRQAVLEEEVAAAGLEPASRRVRTGCSPV